ncbi:MAG: YceI family protein [Betaproteobacteria bacterium]
MKPLIAALFTSLVATSAGAIEYSGVQAEKSRIAFVSRQMGVAVNGRFPTFTAQVIFDPARPEAGKVNIGIDLAGIDAGSKDANDEVVGKDWFNVRMFPTATFTSTQVKGLGGDKYQVTGPLTIKNKSQVVTAPFTFKADGGNGIFEGSFIVKRVDFAIGEGPWTDLSMVANDVLVNFHVVAAASATLAPARLK